MPLGVTSTTGVQGSLSRRHFTLPSGLWIRRWRSSRAFASYRIPVLCRYTHAHFGIRRPCQHHLGQLSTLGPRHPMTQILYRMRVTSTRGATAETSGGIPSTMEVRILRRKSPPTPMAYRPSLPGRCQESSRRRRRRLEERLAVSLDLANDAPQSSYGKASTTSLPHLHSFN